MHETREDFVSSLKTYVGGALTLAQGTLKRFFVDYGDAGLAEGGEKKGPSLLAVLSSTER